MRILVCHNFYQQPGGEDQSFAGEAAMLEAFGHRVVRFTRHNRDIAGRPRLGAAADTLWNRRVARELAEAVRGQAIDVAHFQNTFPIISPAAYHAVGRLGVPVVQSLRNYRLLCPNALFYRDGHVCEDCLGRSIPWPGVLHRCYRGSVGASAVTAAMLTAHRALGTWSDAVDMYIANTEFSRRKFIEGGLPADRVAVKPNFVYPDPGPGAGRGGFALYAGRLTPEKGIATLLAAWKLLGGRLPLRIAGDGPLAPLVREAAGGPDAVEYLGHRTPLEVSDLMGDASVLVFPSEWYETFGRTIVEAFAKGTPVVAAALGGVTAMIDPGRTGLHYPPGDAEALAGRVEALLGDPGMLARMRPEARREFELCYTAERNHAMLLEIYGRAVERRRGAPAPA
ncbi:MAG TPA: glycosyltransferase [Gemmatimonadales bacterium]|nr:glycosyltransferase [Gemmatimonadales bacterium]